MILLIMFFGIVLTIYYLFHPPVAKDPAPAQTETASEEFYEEIPEEDERICCPYCYTYNEPDAEKCYNCGTRLKDTNGSDCNYSF